MTRSVSRWFKRVVGAVLAPMVGVALAQAPYFPDVYLAPQFEAPGNIVFVTLPSGQSEAFITGTQPEGLLPEDEGISASGTPVP